MIVCPGFHEPALTDGFVRSLPSFVVPHVVKTFPADPWSTFCKIREVFQEQAVGQAVAGIGFSGGVVGLVGALKIWQQQGGAIAKLIAIDGWGVPTLDLPVCRMSHDEFTHVTSAALEKKGSHFYADLAVDHLAMWGAPAQVKGWQTKGPQVRKSSDKQITAADFIADQLQDLV